MVPQPIIGLLICLVMVLPTPGQGICIPAPISVASIKGTVLFELPGKRLPLREVTIRVLEYKSKRSIASFVTKDDGEFSLASISPGRYYLSAEAEGIIGITVELRIDQKSQRLDQDIEFILRNDPMRPCGVASVNVSPESTSKGQDTDLPRSRK